ncbi:hypothetical protein BDN72DRAFT_864852 [Pluteus cervinus]|uniref:Uncharacterized protein n=1 Tax=Pluteus cervinus TaxID=181527 RepID=A0ACD3A3E4_9AGAR|nr:hypothetical protein BDN72DRAFT_864852 [Pluteus cervinus]
MMRDYAREIRRHERDPGTKIAVGESGMSRAQEWQVQGGRRRGTGSSGERAAHHEKNLRHAKMRGPRHGERNEQLAGAAGEAETTAAPKKKTPTTKKPSGTRKLPGRGRRRARTEPVGAQGHGGTGGSPPESTQHQKGAGRGRRQRRDGGEGRTAAGTASKGRTAAVTESGDDEGGEGHGGRRRRRWDGRMARERDGSEGKGRMGGGDHHPADRFHIAGWCRVWAQRALGEITEGLD